MKYSIVLQGCDASTSIDIDLTTEELSFVERLAQESESQSEYGCMPTMHVEKWVDSND